VIVSFSREHSASAGSIARETLAAKQFLGRRHFTGVISVMGPELLGRCIDQYAAALLLFARQWCDCADDVVQEAFVRLASQATRPDNIAAWLHRVVRNGAISAIRAARRRQRYEMEAAARRPAWFEPADTALDADAVTTALERLPVEQREVVVAHLWGGLSFEQVGELTGTSSSTAHRRYLTALQTLRERLRVPCPRTN
jgi:RNA polymerase sigma-70 factor (ECF subfamily)